MAAGDQRQANHGLKHPAAECFVERRSNPHQNSSPDQVENALGDVQPAGENDQTDKRRHAAARQHAVVDFQHEERAGQVQKVDHGAHGADAKEGATAGPQRVAELGPGRSVGRPWLPALHDQIPRARDRQALPPL